MPDPAYAGLGAWRLLLTHYLMLREKAASLLSMRDLKKQNGGWCIKSAVKRNICIIDSLTRGLESLSSLFDKEKKKKRKPKEEKNKDELLIKKHKNFILYKLSFEKYFPLECDALL